MARILGIDIPDNKELFIAITKIYGIGVSTSWKILQFMLFKKYVFEKKLSEENLKTLKTLGTTRVNKLSKEIIANLSQAIVKFQYNESTQKFLIEGDLRKKVLDDIANLKEINCYVGIRHKRNLPVHGQRTRTNARTRKGPRKTVANKKIEGK